MTDKWTLYHQTGPDGQEWGIKIRPGYIVTGFAREDAEAVVAWQNASCGPASDVLERAKDAASIEYAPDISYDDWRDLVRELIAEVERLRVHHCDDCCCAQAWAALGITEYTGRSIPEEIIRLKEWMIKNRDIATSLQYDLTDANNEVERLRDIIDRPPEESEWMTDYHLLYSALDGPIIDAARKWHAAYRKAQNSNLIRSEGLATRIKELEAEQVWICGPNHHEFQKKDLQPGYKLLVCPACGGVIKPKMAWLSDYAERLEAAFLKSEIERRIYQKLCPNPSRTNAAPRVEYWSEVEAREALERIRRCGKG